MTNQRFTDLLREQNHATWEKAVTHRFVQELFGGTIDDSVMASYLIQDYRFLDSFLVLLGAAVSSADSLEPRLRFSQFIGEIAGDENTYFLDAFEALGVTEKQREEIPNTQPTTAFCALMREAADTRNYAAIVAVLLVAEWLYLDWATRDSRPIPKNFVHAEWIRLHDFPEFHERIAFLREELNRVGPSQREVAGDFFHRAVEIELAFFDASYAHPITEEKQ
ncbi:TenA family protein [Corynebacterium casei]|uniref:TenA family protein n=1 Tax=Corynebacterium casei TaxID=160386 RepID=UPI003F8F3059